MNKHTMSVVFSMNSKISFKIIVVGNKHAGKTSLILRFVKDIFQFNYKVTIGVEFYSKTIQDKNEQVALQIWDTAGSENYKSVVRSFYNFAQCIMIVFENKVDLDTNIENWMKQIKQNALEDARLVLVRTKIDLNPISEEEQIKIDQIKQKYSIDIFMPVSAKRNENVTQLFTTIGSHLNYLYKTDERFNGIVHHKSESILITDSILTNSIKKKKKCCEN